MRHKLENVDTNTKTADCTACGQVEIVHSGKWKNGTERWRCKNKSQEHNRKKNETRIAGEGRIPPRPVSCEICGKTKEENRRRLALDHDHKTGNLRGYLCTNCNLGLGCFSDDVDVMEKAIRYLKKEGV